MSAGRFIGSVIYVLAVFALPLFLPAGTIHWPRAWIYVGILFLLTVITLVYVFRDNEELLKERYKPPIQKGQPLVDKVILALFLITFIGTILLIPLDVFRFRLMGGPGPVASALGLIAFVAGWWLLALAERANTFAAPVVRYQEERGQRVIDTGVYFVVRHPMYAGGVLLFFGMPLWLGSTAALVSAGVPALLLVLRIRFEEQFLRRELPGYEEYTRRVRYRLVPFLW